VYILVTSKDRRRTGKEGKTVKICDRSEGNLRMNKIVFDVEYYDIQLSGERRYKEQQNKKKSQPFPKHDLKILHTLSITTFAS